MISVDTFFSIHPGWKLANSDEHNEARRLWRDRLRQKRPYEFAVAATPIKPRVAEYRPERVAVAPTARSVPPIYVKSIAAKSEPEITKWCELCPNKTHALLDNRALCSSHYWLEVFYRRQSTAWRSVVDTWNRLRDVGDPGPYDIHISYDTGNLDAPLDRDSRTHLRARILELQGVGFVGYSEDLPLPPKVKPRRTPEATDTGRQHGPALPLGFLKR